MLSADGNFDAIIYAVIDSAINGDDVSIANRNIGDSDIVRNVVPVVRVRTFCLRDDVIPRMNTTVWTQTGHKLV